MVYLFKTRVYMKPYNAKKYFIINDYVNDIEIESETPFDIDNVIKQYTEKLDNKYGISISKNAIKNKEPLFDENDNIKGYVFTGKTGFEDRHTNTPYTEQYIEVWTRVYKLLSLEGED